MGSKNGVRLFITSFYLTKNEASNREASHLSKIIQLVSRGEEIHYGSRIYKLTHPCISSLTLLTLLISSGCHDKVPQTEWLNNIVYCFTVLEAGDLKSRCWQVHAPSETCSDYLPCLFLVSDVLLAIAGIPGLWLCKSDLCLHCTHGLLSVSLCLHTVSSYKAISHISLGATIL